MTAFSKPSRVLPALAVPCPLCGSQTGALCTSHSGTRQRRTDVHQVRTAAWKTAVQAGTLGTDTDIDTDKNAEDSA